MSSLGVLRDLSEIFLPIGIVGAAIAALCAFVVMIALVRGAAGVVGGAAAVWVGGALLSLASGFTGDWVPALVAVGSLVVALVVGGMLRGVVAAVMSRPKRAQVVVEESAPVAVARPSTVG